MNSFVQARLENVWVPDADYSDEEANTEAEDKIIDTTELSEESLEQVTEVINIGTEATDEDIEEGVTVEPAYEIESRDTDIDILSELRQKV